MKNDRRLIVVLVLTVAMLLIGGSSADAQTTRRLSATPKAFQTFYAKFKSAVLRGDKRAVASMTRFPFSYGWDAGDEGTYTRSQFLRKYNDILGGTRRLFGQSNPKFYNDENSLSLADTSDASHYGFNKKGGKYYFTSIMVEP